MSPRGTGALLPTMVELGAGLSGAAALAYEVVWRRALVVPLGGSSDAATVVLAGFMLGTAAGGWLGGRWAVTTTAPLRRYALLELLLAAWALLAPGLLGSLGRIATVAFGATIAITLRYLGALLLVALPCLAMGATLPLLVQALTTGGRKLRAVVGVVYGANTLGAAAGAFATGFWAIPSVGVWRSGALAAGAGALAAALARLAHRMLSRAPPARLSAPQRRKPQQARTPASRTARLALLAAWASGFVMLGCELVWTRLLTFVFGHDTYAFTTLLATVLLGLGLGGLGHRLLGRHQPVRLLGALLAAFAVLLIASAWLAAALVIARGRDPFGIGASAMGATSVWLELYRELAFAPIMVLAPAALSGAILPAACSLYGRSQGTHRQGAGRAVGAVLLYNGVGAAAGALLTGFLLLPAVGIQSTLVLLAMMAALTGALVLGRGGALAGRRLATVRASWPLLAAGAVAFAMPRALPRAMLLRAVGARHQQLLLYLEGRTATVSVTRNRINGEKQLFINAVGEVTTRLVHDQSFKLLGHLGALLHPHPRRAVMICMGAGLSAGAASLHRLERLDVVDLSPTVVRGARLFARENLRVVDNPIFHFHVGDGRRYLLDSPGGYDLAIVDSTHPKAVDSWLLYTAEFYRLLRTRLAAGGIAVQWVPLHGLSELELRILVGTFASEFPQVSLWANVGYETYGQVGYLKLVGINGPRLELDYARLRKRLAEPAAARDLSAYGIGSIDELVDELLAGPQAIARWTARLPVQTDDHPIVPYLTRWSRGRRMQPRLLLAVREPLAAWLRLLGPSAQPHAAELAAAYEAQGLVIAGDLGRAAALRPKGEKIALYQAQAHTTVPYYDALSARYADDADTLFVAATQLAEQHHARRAHQLFERARTLAPTDVRVRLNLALSWRQLGEPQRALDELDTLHREHPRSALVGLNLGAALLAGGHAGAAAGQLEGAVAADPSSVRARLALAEACLASGRRTRARTLLDALIAENDCVAEAHDLRGQVAARQGELDRAISEHQRAAALDPYSARYHYNLGLALMADGHDDQAATAYRAALRLVPDHAAALNNLGLLAAARGDFSAAADRYVDALQADPNYAEAAHNLGLALKAQHRPGEAIGAFCLALRIRPDLAPAARALRELGTDPSSCDR